MSSQEQELSHSSAPKPPQRVPNLGYGRFIVVVILLLLFLGVLFTTGLLPRINKQKELANDNQVEKSLLTNVSVVTPHRAAANISLDLPGNIEAIEETAILARTNGYLKRWFVDIGDHVKAGQLLAEISAPETDQDILQAQANLASARANLAQAQANYEQANASVTQAQTNLEFAQVSFERWDKMTKQGDVPRQERDEKESSFKARRADLEAAKAKLSASNAAIVASQANISANEANVKRLQELQLFQKVVAPFDGVVTARNTDTGMLVTAGASANASPLYKVARVDTLRVFINVPQTYVEAIHTGQNVAITLREFPQKKFSGKVVRTTSSLDANARTLLTEVHFSNDATKLMPGMYAQVKLEVNNGVNALMLPSTALMVKAKGLQVATLDANQTVHFKPIEVGRDFGAEIEVVAGLLENEPVILNPSDNLQEGLKVQPIPQKN